MKTLTWHTLDRRDNPRWIALEENADIGAVRVVPNITGDEIRYMWTYGKRYGYAATIAEAMEMVESLHTFEHGPAQFVVARDTLALTRTPCPPDHKTVRELRILDLFEDTPPHMVHVYHDGYWIAETVPGTYLLLVDRSEYSGNDLAFLEGCLNNWKIENAE